MDRDEEGISEGERELEEEQEEGDAEATLIILIKEEECIKCVKNNKSPEENSICAEILKQGDEELTERIWRLIIQIWEEEKF